MIFADVMSYHATFVRFFFFHNVHAVNVRTYAHLQRRAIIFRIRRRRIDTPHEDAPRRRRVGCALRNGPSHSREAGNTLAVFICVHLLRPLFIQARREMTPRNGRNHPRIIAKGDSATQRRLFPFSYYNATTSIAACDLHSSRASAISTNFDYLYILFYFDLIRLNLTTAVRPKSIIICAEYSSNVGMFLLRCCNTARILCSMNNFKVARLFQSFSRIKYIFSCIREDVTARARVLYKFNKLDGFSSRLILISSLHLAGFGIPESHRSRTPREIYFFIPLGGRWTTRTRPRSCMGCVHLKRFFFFFFVRSRPKNVKAETPRGADFCAGFIAGCRRLYVTLRATETSLVIVTFGFLEVVRAPEESW